MPDYSEANIVTADALTLLLHNQHAICAAIEEVTKSLSENGVEGVAANAIAAMATYPSGQVIYPTPRGQDMVCT